VSQHLHIPFEDLADYYEAGWVLYGPSDTPGFVTVAWKRLRAAVVPFACVADVIATSSGCRCGRRRNEHSHRFSGRSARGAVLKLTLAAIAGFLTWLKVFERLRPSRPILINRIEPSRPTWVLLRVPSELHDNNQVRRTTHLKGLAKMANRIRSGSVSRTIPVSQLKSPHGRELS
jgi:hypothetical protein